MKHSNLLQNLVRIFLLVVIATSALSLTMPIYAQENDWTEVARMSLDLWGTITSLRYHGMAYLGDDRVLLFGGIANQGSTSETSVFDLSSDHWNWKEGLIERPECRRGMGMAYVGGDKVLLYGGGYDHTWIYDDSENRWSQQYPQDNPGRRTSQAMAYIGDDKVLLFGGSKFNFNTASYEESDETWIYDLSENNWTRLYPNSIPSARSDHAMTYFGGDRVFLFGGNEMYHHYNDTWIYDLSEGNWIQQNPAQKPSARTEHDMAYIGNGQVVLFGGVIRWGTGYQEYSDTWVYDLNENSWTEDQDEPGAPQPWSRYGHGFSETSMDGSTKPVMFGGKTSDWGESNLATWMFGGGDYLPEENPTSITVLQPNGGETWYVGEWYTITWESDKYTGKVMIEISTTGGNSWWDVTQGSFTENDGSYSYKAIQENISDHCLFRVTSMANPSAKDQSDGVFTITSSNANPAPTNLIALSGYHQAIPLIWKAPTNGTPQGYNVYRNSQKIASNISRTYYRVEGAAHSSTSNYQVTAVYSDGESDFSNTISGTAYSFGYYINSGWASSAPNLNGIINSTEWTDAATTTITYPGESGTVTLYVMNDDNYLYVAVDDGVDNSLDNNDNFGFGFDDNHDREFPPTGPSSEGRIRIIWNNSASNGFSGVYGHFPDNLNFESWATPSGVSQGIGNTSGHVHYEGRIDLNSSPLQSSPGNTIGIAFYCWNGANSSYTGMWPETLLDLQDYASNHWWFYTPFGWGDLKLASSSGDTPGSKKWEFVTRDYVMSSPAIGSDGTIYVGSSGALYAINSNGTQKWDYVLEGYLMQSPAIGLDGTIYVGSYIEEESGMLHAINPNGTNKWEFNTGEEIVSSPAIGSDGTIYVGSADYKLYAIDPSGTKKWEAEIGTDDFYTGLAIGSDGTIYAGSTDNKLYAINPDGTAKWDYETGDAIAGSSPAIGSDGTIYVGSTDNKLYAINPDGTLKWDYETGHDVRSSPAIGSDGTIYVGSYDFTLSAINPNGTPKWVFPTNRFVSSSPAISSDGTIYVGSTDNKLYAINPDGTRKWEFETGDFVNSSPAIGSDGTIYVGSRDGKLYAINGNSGGLADTPWPMFHHDVRHTGRAETTIPINYWNVQNSGTENNLYYADAVSKDVSWVAGGYQTVLRTSNGGTAWSGVWSSDAVGIYCISAIDNSSAFAASNMGNTGHIYKTTNGGSSWTKVYEKSDVWMAHITMFDSNEGIAIGRPIDGHWTILKTTNGGDNWQQMAGAPAGASDEAIARTAVIWLSNQEGWFGVQNRPKAFHTTNGGSSWTEVSCSPLSGVLTINFNRNQPAIGLAASDYNLVKTTNNGASWQEITPPANGKIYHITCHQGAFWILIESEIYKSSDNGSTWELQYAADNSLRHCDFTTDQQGSFGWAVGTNGTILKYEDFSAAPVLAVNPASLDFGGTATNKAFNISNSGSGTLTWTVSENESWITSVTPASGTGNGTVTVTVDRSGLTPGNYTGKVSVTSNGGNRDVTITVYKDGGFPGHWQFTQTANSATIVLPTSANPNINGSSLASGDYVGVFTPAGLCCGYSVWQNTDMAITAWGDDNQTTEIDGFKANEVIAYRVYRLAEQKEWKAVETGYSEGTGTYSNDGFMVLNKFNVSDGKTITLNFTESWNMFSMNVNPANPDVAAVMAPVVDELKIMKNGTGKTYIPQYNINTIGNMDFKEGYQAYFTSAVTLSVAGDAVAPNTPIELKASWNMISYLPDVPIDIETALGTITDKIIIAKNGQGKSYIPAYSINQIGDMQPGQGYKLCLDAAATLIYPASSYSPASDSSKLARSSVKLIFEHFQFTANTGENATIVLPVEINPQYSDNTPLEVSDEIGVFNSEGVCCGAVVWQAENTAITAWDDNSETEEVDGFKSGEALHFRVWSKSTDEEFPAQVQFQNAQSAVYQTDGFSVLTELVALSTDVAQAAETTIPTQFSLLQNYPNPFNPETTIEYHLPESGLVTLEVYNLKGQRVKQLIAGNQAPGVYRLAWDGTDDSGKNVVSGVYVYTIQAGEYQQSRKMILMK